jgi:hypothetical protein
MTVLARPLFFCGRHDTGMALVYRVSRVESRARGPPTPWTSEVPPVPPDNLPAGAAELPGTGPRLLPWCGNSPGADEVPHFTRGARWNWDCPSYPD